MMIVSGCQNGVMTDNKNAVRSNLPNYTSMKDEEAMDSKVHQKPPNKQTNKHLHQNEGLSKTNQYGISQPFMHQLSFDCRCILAFMMCTT